MQPAVAAFIRLRQLKFVDNRLQLQRNSKRHFFTKVLFHEKGQEF